MSWWNEGREHYTDQQRKNEVQTMKNTKKNFGAETVEQFKVMQYINEHFEENALELELVDRFTIRATDHTGASLIFYYDAESDGVKTRGED